MMRVQLPIKNLCRSHLRRIRIQFIQIELTSNELNLKRFDENNNPLDSVEILALLESHQLVKEYLLSVVDDIEDFGVGLAGDEEVRVAKGDVLDSLGEDFDGVELAHGVLVPVLLDLHLLIQNIFYNV